MAFLPLLFLSLIAFAHSCKIKTECDATCTDLKAYIAANPVKNSRFRLQYHVSTPVGWMNDPNGFVYYKGNYHIFYQYYPLDSVWGPMHWGHSTSPDLVNWTTQPTALIPGTEQCFSGSAIVYDTSLILMYTGHIVSASGTTESQYLAFSDDGINFLKYANNPVLTYSGSPDFRDPKVWEHNGQYYVVIGSTVSESGSNKTRGSVRLYRSEDLHSWTFVKVLAESAATGNQASVYMWECPDFFELGGKYILLMSPQGMTADGDRYKNKYQTGYIIGSFDYQTNNFVEEVPFQEIDYGHDFYATQTTERENNRYLIAWFGMWESPFPEAQDGWAGALTIFRKLELSNNRILMNPVDDITMLRQPAVHNGSLAAKGSFTLKETGELIVTAEWTKNVKLELKGAKTGSAANDTITLTWTPTTQKVALIRNRSGEDDVRQVEWTATGDWRIFLDTSSIEMFCGDGDVVFSSRAYVLGGWQVDNLGDDALTVVAFPLSRSVPE